MSLPQEQKSGKDETHSSEGKGRKEKVGEKRGRREAKSGSSFLLSLQLRKFTSVSMGGVAARC